LTVAGGACETNDLRFDGDVAGTLAGDIAGTYEGVVNVLLSDGCQVLEVDTYETAEDEQGNRIEARTVSISVNRIGSTTGEIVPGTTSTVRTIGVITDSAGIYAGATGTWDCDLISTQQPDGRAILDGECVVRIAVDEPPPADLAVSVNRERVGVSANSRGEPNTLDMRGVYVVNGSALSGVTLRLIAPDGVELNVESASPVESDALSAKGWSLPPAEAGEPVLFAVTARLRSATADEFDVYVELDANELPQPVRSAPIHLDVVR
jgi:hypothetical protein